MTFHGGYALIRQDLIRGHINKHTAANPDALSDEALSAINHVQDTPWRINRFIYEVAQEAFNAGLTLNGLIPQPHQHEINRVPEAIWEAMSEADRKVHKARLRKLREENAKNPALVEEWLRKLGIAHDLVNQPEIFFPHFFDFRLRMYPIPQDLHPQGDDFAQGLLMFATGVKLGHTGLYWLGVRIATDAGQDKLHFDDRVRWVVDNEFMIRRCARQPLAPECLEFWTKMDSPWRFLAGCFEWNEAHLLGRPEEFVSHLSVPMDGSINGCQHLSMLGRDTIGAEATNCRNLPTRRDLYQEVADRVKALVERDAANGNLTAMEWLGKVTRSTVKRAVMTTPYGVTDQGIREFMFADGHVDDLDDKVSAAIYMQKAISAALDETMANGRAIMAYLQALAKVLAERNIALRWRTPNGSECVQSYYAVASRRVNTVVGKLMLLEESDQNTLLPRKCALAAAPNVIHSLDATMLQTVVNRLFEYGVRSFHMIHDSYGCHAAHVTAMRRIIREVAFDQYSGDYLKEFHEFVKSYTPADLELPNPPARGDWDIAEVLESVFFFS